MLSNAFWDDSYVRATWGPMPPAPVPFDDGDDGRAIIERAYAGVSEGKVVQAGAVSELFVAAAHPDLLDTHDLAGPAPHTGRFTEWGQVAWDHAAMVARHVNNPTTVYSQQKYDGDNGEGASAWLGPTRTPMEVAAPITARTRSRPRPTRWPRAHGHILDLATGTPRLEPRRARRGARLPQDLRLPRHDWRAVLLRALRSGGVVVVEVETVRALERQPQRSGARWPPSRASSNELLCALAGLEIDHREDWTDVRSLASSRAARCPPPRAARSQGLDEAHEPRAVRAREPAERVS